MLCAHDETINNAVTDTYYTVVPLLDDHAAMMAARLKYFWYILAGLPAGMIKKAHTRPNPARILVCVACD